MAARAPTAYDALIAWRRLPYQHQGSCSRCRFDRDEDGHALWVGRAAGSTRWWCRSCYQRQHVRPAAHRRRSA